MAADPVAADPLAAELLDVALSAADAAVQLIHHQRPESFGVESKSSATDLVTEMDKASEQLIRSVIARHRPDDLVVGEEQGSLGDAAARVVWCVDPIDGTTNYVYDHPGYNVSIAASIDGVMSVGVVADPTHGRTYRAVLGQGAFCNDRRLRLESASPTLAETLVATGFGYDPERRARQGAVVAELLPQIRDIRRMGAAALDLCSVAAGRVDAYYESGLGWWDLAAGVLIASEAGARVASVGGGPFQDGELLAAHPDRFDELAALLHSLGAHLV